MVLNTGNIILNGECFTQSDDRSSAVSFQHFCCVSDFVGFVETFRTPKYENFNKCNTAHSMLYHFTTKVNIIIDSRDAKCENGLRGAGYGPEN